MHCCDMTKYGIYDPDRWKEEALSCIASSEIRKEWGTRLLQTLGKKKASQIKFTSQICFRQSQFVIFKMLLESKSRKLLQEAVNMLGLSD